MLPDFRLRQRDYLLEISRALTQAIAVFNARLYGQVSYEKQRLDALLDAAADGILILNADHTIERCNISFEKLFGEPRDQVIGRNHEDIIRWSGDPKGKTLEKVIAMGERELGLR